MPPVGIYQGVVDRNDETGIWVKINIGSNQSDELPTPALVVTNTATAPDGTEYTLGPNVANGSQVLIDFQEANIGKPVILGNYTSASVVPWQSSPPGTLLTSHQYKPASLQTYAVGTSLAGVDTTNLTVSFTAPGSGSVLLGANIDGVVTPSASATYSTALALCFVTHSTTTQVSPLKRYLQNWSAGSTTTGGTGGTCEYKALVGGLTPGAGYQYDLAALVTTTAPSGAAADLYVDSGSGGSFVPAGPAFLTVWAA